MTNLISTNHFAEQILRLPAVLAMTGKCRSSLYSEIKAGRFPRQKNIGKRAVGWSYLEIQEYIRVTLAGGQWYAI